MAVVCWEILRNFEIFERGRVEFLLLSGNSAILFSTVEIVYNDLQKAL
jgi:hypothetical protein